MKFIFSRKGFDSANGGYPSPILPDGTLLNLPIPSTGDRITYNDLRINDSTYYQIMKELGAHKKLATQTCHLDPDIKPDVIKRENGWLPSFGQVEGAATHLLNQSVSVGDIFLFFGWFSKTKIIKNKELRYCKDINYPSGLHVIYGYLQVGKILKMDSAANSPAWLNYHPHCEPDRRKLINNSIYIASEKLSLCPTMSGAGTFSFKENLILTKKGHTRSKWGIPKNVFKDIEISHHPNAWKDDYFKSVDIGQEFVVNANDRCVDWLKSIIKT